MSRARRLGFVLGTSDEADLRLLCRLALAALGAGCEVRLFLMHEAVGWLGRPELAALVEAGADATYCGTNAAGGELAAETPVREGSQLDHAALLRECERVLTLA